MKYYLDVLKKYAVFSGRASRQEFWMFFLFNIIFSVIAMTIDINISSNPFSFAKSASGHGLIQSLYSLVVFIPSLTVGVRRLHDTNRSGWWMLVPLLSIPFTFVPSIFPFALLTVLVLGVVIFIFYLQDSTPGDNKYGPNPKGIPATSSS